MPWLLVSLGLWTLDLINLQVRCMRRTSHLVPLTSPVPRLTSHVAPLALLVCARFSPFNPQHAGLLAARYLLSREFVAKSSGSTAWAFLAMALV